jgi:hypothetical protein
MKILRIVLFTLLVMYSLALLGIDISLSEFHVRGYFSDIVDGVNYPLPYFALFGINTTLTVVLLIGISILFSVSIVCINKSGNDRKSLIFAWSQFIFFFYLACDERLMIHEKIDMIFGVNDSILLLLLGVMELFFLFVFGNVLRQERKMKICLLKACVLFAFMVFVDAFLKGQISGRLSLEDLSKTWAIVFLYIYAWRYCMTWINKLSKGVADGA